VKSGRFEPHSKTVWLLVRVRPAPPRIPEFHQLVETCAISPHLADIPGVQFGRHSLCRQDLALFGASFSDQSLGTSLPFRFVANNRVYKIHAAYQANYQAEQKWPIAEAVGRETNLVGPRMSLVLQLSCTKNRRGQ